MRVILICNSGNPVLQRVLQVMPRKQKINRQKVIHRFALFLSVSISQHYDLFMVCQNNETCC